MRLSNIYLFWPILFILLSCSSGPDLQRLPIAEIDRPYTLPYNVDSWEVSAGAGYSSDDTSNEHTYTVPFLLPKWTDSIADNWNLIWTLFPIPIGVLHQFTNTETLRIGASFYVRGVGYGSGSTQGLILFPVLSAQFRLKLNSNLALDLSPVFGSRIFTRLNFTKSVSLATGLVYQISSDFYLKPIFSLANSDRIRKQRIIFVGDVYTYDSTRETFYSFALESGWRMNPSWEMRPYYEHTRGPNHYVGNSFTIDFINYW